MPFPIAYLIDRPAPSETFVRREIEHLRRNGWPVVDAALVGAQALAPDLSKCPPKARSRLFRAARSRVAAELLGSPLVACRILKRLPQAATLASLASENGARLLHAHFAGITADLVSVAAAALELPWTCSVHAHDVFTASPRALFRRLRTARGVVACSRRAADAVARCGFPADRLAVIHHGLPLDEYPFGDPHDDGVVLAAGRLEAKKGIDTLVQACGHLRTRGARFACVVAGDGSQKDELVRLVKRLNLEEAVSFVGWKSSDELKGLVARASVLAVPSRQTPQGDRDGLSNVLVEALALGTPVVTTGAGAAEEVIVSGTNGILVPPDDPIELARALEALLASSDLRARLAREARRTAEQLFDGIETTRQLEAFFTRAVREAR